MSNLKVGEFVRWSSTEDGEAFSHSGKIIKLTKTHISFIPSPTSGAFTVPLNDGTFEKIRKIKGWKDVPVAKTKRKKKPSVTVHVRKPRNGGPSKKEQALELYRAMAVDSAPSRKVVIQHFVDELDMTPAGASTYAAMCKKAHK